MVIKEDSQLYKGIFWIKDLEDIDNNELYFQVPCDTYGNIDSNIELNSKSGKSFNHEKTWSKLSSKYTDNQPYNYYPRGRVEISNGVATIYCSPYICTDELKKWITSKYNLNSHNGIKKIKLVADGSNHYKCYLDN